MTGLRKKRFVSFRFYEKNIFFLNKCFYTSFDQNYNCTFLNVFVSFWYWICSISKLYYRRWGNILVGRIGLRNARQVGCRKWGMHDRMGTGHEECTTGGMKDMSKTVNVNVSILFVFLPRKINTSFFIVFINKKIVSFALVSCECFRFV